MADGAAHTEIPDALRAADLDVPRALNGVGEPRAAVPVATRPILADHPDADEPRRLFNRELSWLGFNERVLARAARDDVPLLDRAKYLAIFTDNLDEFFQVRVAGLLEQEAAGVAHNPPDGMRPSEQLAAIRAYADELMQRQATLFRERITPALAAEGVRFSDWDTLDDDDRAWLVREFDDRVFPVLTPLAVDPAHPFPYISNLSLNLAVVVYDGVAGERHFARVKVPPILPRFIVMPDGERFVPLEQVIAAHLDRLFPGLDVIDHHVFRVTRNADLVVEEEEADDLLLAIESELKQRRRGGRVVRVEVEPGMPPEILDLLMRELRIDAGRVYEIEGPLDLSGLRALAELDRPELKYPPFTPVVPPRLSSPTGDDVDVFDAIARGDILMHHPYESFAASVQHFIETAARDPQVLAIKITLYRTGPGSPIVRSLVRAAEEGKQVVALVELKARFDEEANIEWARVLEEAGVHVAYGVVGLKTHTKIMLVARKEGDHIRRYCHIGTGNYNDRTARVYEDLGLLSADAEIGADITDLFNVLTGYGRRREYRRVTTAPTSFRPHILELIERETEADDGSIVMKLNALADAEMTEALYRASQAGTVVDLIVRGICCLRPGVEGLSDRITVRSVIGRYLEHSRIFRFGSDRRGYDYIVGSGDLMPRNLDRRVETLVPIRDPALTPRLEHILQVLLEDDVLAWSLGPDGAWTRVPTHAGLESHLRLQQDVLERA